MCIGKNSHSVTFEVMKKIDFLIPSNFMAAKNRDLGTKCVFLAETLPVCKING